jgi:hypothetical protein
MVETRNDTHYIIIYLDVNVLRFHHLPTAYPALVVPLRYVLGVTRICSQKLIEVSQIFPVVGLHRKHNLVQETSVFDQVSLSIES